MTTSPYIPDYRECRFCRQSATTNQLVKYAVRSYAHARCLLTAKGEAAFDGLSNHSLEMFPALVANDFGLFDALRIRIDLMKKANAGIASRMGK
jgi:hypothetical protein